MEHINVYAKINEDYYELTGSEKKVADYIITYQRKTQYMSISELAEECGVADATVSRFCKRLGYKGYNAFKLAIASSETSSAAEYSDNPLTGEVSSTDSIQEMCEKIYSGDIGAVTDTMKLIQPEKIIQAADVLTGANRVLCMGQGGSMILAQESAHLFSTAMAGFVCVWDSHLQAISASQLTERDAVLFFSYSGATRDSVELLKIVRSVGAKSILITRFPKSPSAELADIVLQCGSKEGPLQLGSVGARMAQLYLVDVLFSEVCRRDIEGCRIHREQVAEALTDKHL